MVRLLLFCVLTGFVNSAIADNVVVIVRGAPFAEDDYDESFGEDFGEMLGGMGVKARILDIGELGKVINYSVDDNLTKSQLGPNDRIIGFLVHAHGSTQSLHYENCTSCTADVRMVSGKRFADMLIRILPVDQIGNEFFVYLDCCNQGGSTRKGKNFQDEFYVRLQQKLSEEIPLKRLVVFAFTQATGAGNFSSAFIDRRLNEEIGSNRVLRLPLLWIRYTQSDAAFQRQLASPVRRFINWHHSGIDRPVRAIALLLGAGWVVSEFFGLGFGSGALASLSLHVWAVHNGLIGRSSARVRQWSSSRELEIRSSIRDLQKRFLPRGRCSQALKN
ncbi:MAG: hypothetical protein IPJ71_03100 [Bdellovibrionales bacterium]|nr:hypothetical protein [Bdellovibrionales bacterium]